MQDDFAKDLANVGKIDAVQNILEVVCRTTGMGFSAVARVTESRWIACAVRDEIAFGLKPGGELEVQTTICDEIRDSGQAVVIDHVAEDMAFCAHHTPKQYGFQSYASFPIRLPDGRFFGTLCAIDPRPAKLNRPEVIGMFKLFADLIGMHLDSQEKIVASEAALLNEREAARLREQFIAVLGHDLRNPLSAVQSGAELLRMISTDAETLEILDVIQRSTKRMSALINDVLDFARGRLGGGLTVSCKPNANLGDAIRHVVNELQTATPDRTIELGIELDCPVPCDTSRICQMLSNLLSNALTHGDAASPIWINVQTAGAMFELSVTNRGPTMSADILSRLFEPFARGENRSGQEGLGLGLYIATEIAKAHHGKLEVSSADGQTRFTFRMPIENQ